MQRYIDRHTKQTKKKHSKPKQNTQKARTHKTQSKHIYKNAHNTHKTYT